MSETDKIQELQGALIEAESRIHELENLLLNSAARSGVLNSISREKEAEIQNLKIGNERLQKQVDEVSEELQKWLRGDKKLPPAPSFD